VTFDKPPDQPFNNADQLELQAVIAAQEESELQAAIEASKEQQPTFREL
jgi:hypothetical protein